MWSGKDRRGSVPTTVAANEAQLCRNGSLSRGLFAQPPFRCGTVHGELAATAKRAHCRAERSTADSIAVWTGMAQYGFPLH